MAEHGAVDIFSKQHSCLSSLVHTWFGLDLHWSCWMLIISAAHTHTHTPPHTESANMTDIIAIACVTVVNVKSSLWNLLEMSSSPCWPLPVPHVRCCLSLSAVTRINKDFIEGHKSFLPSETSRHKFQHSCSETLHPFCTHPHTHPKTDIKKKKKR